MLDFAFSNIVAGGGMPVVFFSKHAPISEAAEVDASLSLPKEPPISTVVKA